MIQFQFAPARSQFSGHFYLIAISAPASGHLRKSNNDFKQCYVEMRPGNKIQYKTKVDLKNRDITVIAEILGPITAIGISRREWRGVVPTNLNNWPPIFCLPANLSTGHCFFAPGVLVPRLLYEPNARANLS